MVTATADSDGKVSRRRRQETLGAPARTFVGSGSSLEVEVEAEAEVEAGAARSGMRSS
jgi:hypothetical protein